MDWTKRFNPKGPNKEKIPCISIKLGEESLRRLSIQEAVKVLDQLSDDKQRTQLGTAIEQARVKLGLAQVN